MASSAGASSSKPHIQLTERGYRDLKSKIIKLKEEIAAGRFLQTKEKLVTSGKTLQSHVQWLLSNSSLDDVSTEASSLGVDALCVLDGFPLGSTDKDTEDIHKDILSGSAELPQIQKIPRYTTWIPLERNRRMTDHQHVVGKKRIYGDDSETDAFICTDSEDIAGWNEKKRKFSEGEDRILWMAFEEHGLDGDVVDVVRGFIEGASSESLLERFNELKLKLEASRPQRWTERNVLQEKSLSAALDSFDKLFCRRCLIFDCPRHDCSQSLVYPRGKQLSVSKPEAGKLCSDQCYLLSDGLEEGKRLAGSSEWTPIEKDLYDKGLEIFGRNSCLIRRNLLSGLKTCMEVFEYMRKNGALAAEKCVVHGSEDHSRADTDFMEQEMASRSASKRIRKRRRTGKLKYSLKPTGRRLSWIMTSNGNILRKQYTPCACQFGCGKECSCLERGTCCEKYCGCSMSCKNRFRGCHCAKSECRRRQCPCFAANRECDPDVCRNCWVSCGGGSLGEPVKKGDVQCGNMNILLNQRQRILLARSDVSGWGAFTENAVKKNEYLGEYTGELISHQEAGERGEIYDRANKSFLFNLNDQFCVDALRQGDALKFANHSFKPNCECKIMQVQGDHRIGIFAKRCIEAREELFIDYRYGSDSGFDWAKKPESSKRKDSRASQGCAKKHTSH